MDQVRVERDPALSSVVARPPGPLNREKWNGDAASFRK